MHLGMRMEQEIIPLSLASLLRRRERERVAARLFPLRHIHVVRGAGRAFAMPKRLWRRSGREERR
jgi:hypothetical protein